MTKIKLCGLSRIYDIEAVNELKPEYVGFVLAQKSKRYVTSKKAKELKQLLDPGIKAVGVFVKEEPQVVAGLLNEGIIDIAQLHGGEDESYIQHLRRLTDKPIIKAFRIETKEDADDAQLSSADYILLDSGSGGTGKAFNWELIQHLKRPYFLAGGLGSGNVKEAIEMLRPYAVDVSSSMETNGVKDKDKMAAFVAAVRKEG
ncbi:MAG: phosphoribosylanthranilate isomerase [Lachnospiraceae bacterium]